MTGALHRTGSTALASTSPPLPGYLVAATERSISVRVGDGTWTFHRTDVLDITRWDAAAAGSCEGRPVLVRVRSGATADFTQRRRVELTDRPLTLAPDHSPARGDDELGRLTEIWARGLDLTTATGVGGATMTCCQTRSHHGSDDGIACDSLD
ncbi:hypothetical protein [Nocardia seriolae]|uniref:hypothetical protein n=1 Tax=Nocardia seriolae TaxID=37332 RepID=UPI00051A3138|nr:hypothetical protein [Nocardia seriolae]MTJ64025.1 hypothetical protein [Nocardia seriolae]MTJ71307.1 hypothetical protein [Nocardia seriolae]MTJ88586.1 hypothetical protein [Nocardia seriolae]MTK32570.1 hypothetical protein [Nocardia seriolae]MTK41911.1 hypothetical protein [Nocardia seriolae]